MSNTITVLRWTIRLTGLLALLLGLVFWTGTGFSLLAVHQGLGLLLSAALIWLVLLGFVRSVSPALLGLALLCAVALPVIGNLQGRLLPGQNHWLTEVLHLLLGIGAIALAEVIGGRLRTRPEPATVRGA